ncbi:MAG: Ig-like domain-containing protein [Firmicutes bacterium]|nr:Ig-like domain-containing protein [Bacillota bacterium]
MSKRFKATTSIMLACAMMCIAMSSVPVFAAGGATDGGTDMNAIETAFSAYKIGETKQISDDGYIGVPVELSVFYDTAKGAVATGYNSTKVALYVVDTAMERIGTATDEEIITDFLERGFIVAALGYKGNAKAVSPGLDYSLQNFYSPMQTKNSCIVGIDNTIIPAGEYWNSYVIPAGYNVKEEQIFWEIDKHGTDGTMEKIVEIWNNDFRGTKGTRLVKWVYADGTRKATQNGIDGSAPQWLNQNGAADANGEYILVKHTLAKKITDCVNPDGSPLNLDLTMSIIYPVNPETPVPVIALSNSAGTLTSNLKDAKYGQYNGFIFNGFVLACFDYGFVPMARDDSYGYFDGGAASGHVTGDHMNYAIHTYNNNKINTAVVRYLRSFGERAETSLNGKIGIIGNSKGGWTQFLGRKELREATPQGGFSTLSEAIDARLRGISDSRQFAMYNGNTRYGNGKTEGYSYDVYTGMNAIEGGEMQPWLTYSDGSEILSYADAIIPSCASLQQDIAEGHSPLFFTSNFQDEWKAQWGTSNEMYNLTRTLDIPSVFFEVDTGHRITVGNDVNYDVDTYNAIFDFYGYYLKGNAVNVIYTKPSSGEPGLLTTEPVVIKFIGPVLSEQIETIKITDTNGNEAEGVWAAAFGNTEWTFTPTPVWKGNTEYTLTIPADFCGDNGVQMGAAYTMSFSTEQSSSVAYPADESGYFEVDCPALSSESNHGGIRFYVSNDAANAANLYAVSGADDTSGTLLGSIYLKGAGYYEFDITEYIQNKTVGEKLKFRISPKKDIATNSVNALNNYSKGSLANVKKIESGDFNNSYEVSINTNGNAHPNACTQGGDDIVRNSSEYYYLSQAMSNNTVIGNNGTITAEDYGRKYTVTLEIYDTVSRTIRLNMNGVTGQATGLMDYDRSIYNFVTKAGEWNEYKLEYAVYEPDYGTSGLGARKVVSFHAAPVCAETDGNGNRIEAPLYVKTFSVVEEITGIEISEVSLAVSSDGSGRYTAPQSQMAWAVYNSENTLVGEYPSLAGAIQNYTSGQTIMMRKNVTLDGGIPSLAGFNKVVIDLGNHKLNAANVSGGVITADGFSNLTMKNGTVALGAAPLVDYGNSEGKFNISFEDLYITLSNNSTLRNVISNNTSTKAITSNISLNGCTLDISDKNLPANSIVIFPAGGGNLDLSYTVTGGSIKLNSYRWISIYENFKNTLYKPDGNGDYTLLVLPATVAVSSTDSFRLASGNMAVFGNAEANGNGYNTYTLENSDSTTIYGKIPEEYLNAEEYPFVAFDENGYFLGASAEFYGKQVATAAINVAKGYLLANTWDGSSYGDNPKEAFVLMRRDYTYPATEYNDNLAQVQGTLVLDLGGHTLSNGTVSEHIFRAGSKAMVTTGDQPIFPTHIEVKNGTMLVGKKPVMRLNVANTAVAYPNADKDFTMEFSDVNFGFAQGATTANLLTECIASGNTVDRSAPFYTIYNNCTFDLKTSAPQTVNPIFNTNTAGYYVHLEITVNGGHITAENIDALAVSAPSPACYDSFVTFEKGANAKFLSLAVPADLEVQTGGYPSSEGTLRFEEEEKDDTTAIYRLEIDDTAIDKTELAAVISEANKYNAEAYTTTSFEIFTTALTRAEGVYNSEDSSQVQINDAKNALEDAIAGLVTYESLNTPYGTIPEAYADKETYPFVVFGENENFVTAGIQFYGENVGTETIGITKNYLAENIWDGTSYGNNPKEAHILLRRDYSFNSGEYYNNLAQVQGVLNIDLGGFTLSQNGGRGAIFDSTSKSWSNDGSTAELSVFPTTITVKNGTILTKTKAIVIMNNADSSGDGRINNKKFSYEFTNVTFGLSEGATTANLLTVYNNANGTSSIAPYFITYNDCVFDISTVKPASPVRELFNADTSGKYMRMEMKINGGEIIADELGYLKVSYLGEAAYNSSIEFGKGADDEYMSLTMPISVNAPTYEYLSHDEVLRFVRESEDEFKATYKLTVVPENGPCTTTTVVKGTGRETTFNIVSRLTTLTGYKVILALYKDDMLTEIKETEYDGTDITFITNAEYDAYKVMVWSDFDEITPLRAAETPN